MDQLGSTPEERLALLNARLSDQVQTAGSQERLRLRRPANVLAGVMLHAAARQERGLELSDLEDGLLRVLREFVPEEEIASYGAAYRAASPTATRRLFPSAVADLPVETSYTLQDLGRDLPAMAGEILAQPNVSVVDVSALKDGESVDGKEFLDAMTASGTGATVFTARAASGTGDPLAGESVLSTVLPVTLAMKRFHCVRDTGDQWGGDDEIYWMCAAGSDADSRNTYTSPVFKSLSNGAGRDFAANSHLFKGEVDQTLLVNIECWEEDSGDIFKELRKAIAGVADSCARAAVSIMEHGAKEEAALAAVIAVVGALINWLLGWLTNDDDLVGERSIAYTRAALAALNGREIQLELSSNEGHYRLWVACRTEPPRQPTPRSNLYVRVMQTPGQWGDRAEVRSFSPFGPALGLTAANQSLKLLFEDAKRLILQDRNFTTGWDPGSFHGPGGATGARPALVDLDKRLYMAFRGAGTDRAVYWADVTREPAEKRKFAGITSGVGPALGRLNGKIYCVVRDDEDELLKWSVYDGTTWTPFRRLHGAVPFRTDVSPALVDYRGALYCVFRMDPAGYLMCAHYDGSTWRLGPDGLSQQYTAAGPALAVYRDKLYLAARGPAGDQSIRWRTYDGNAWSAPTVIAGSHSADGPALAYFGSPIRPVLGGLYLAYRGPGDS